MDEPIAVQVARIDERTKNIAETLERVAREESARAEVLAAAINTARQAAEAAAKAHELAATVAATANEDRLKRHESDIEDLKTWKNRLAGAWVVVSAMFGVHAARH